MPRIVRDSDLADVRGVDVPATSGDTIGPLIKAYDFKHFSIGLPVADRDRSCTPLFRYVAGDARSVGPDQHG